MIKFLDLKWCSNKYSKELHEAVNCVVDGIVYFSMRS